MLQIIKNELSTPVYKFCIEYMIGDADGYHTEEMYIGVGDVELLAKAEKLHKILRKLNPPKGHWGIILDDETIEKIYEEKQISIDEYEFLIEAINDYNTWQGLIRTNYCDDREWLVFENSYFRYIDEHGTEFKCKVI